jgi:hypothetical protein
LARSQEKTDSLENLGIRIELQKHLELTRKLTQNAKAGLKRGSSLRNKSSELFSRALKKPRKEIRIPMEGRAFIALESFLNQTLKAK